ncbi:polyprenyl synthetase family protein [Streptomyces sp. NPDC101150]|uniref:polyprenyl synthetase family protein n=1 Tax=Streptomyces sp. NPDC101150 TaxID=3366114 RepID=UPI003814BA7E
MRPALEEAIDRLLPEVSRILRYHLGWCDEHGRAAQLRGGRSLQAAMVMLAAEATGEDPQHAAVGAAAVELIHTMTELYDDAFDGDDIRRDRPTAWRVFGTDITLLAGVTAISEAFRLIATAPQGGREAAGLLGASLARVCGSYIHEVAFDSCDPRQISLPSLLDNAQEKGGELFGVGAQLGTVLCGHPVQEAELLVTAAHHAGIAWSVANDLEDIWGDAVLTGKRGGLDVKRRRHTPLVILAMQSGHRDTSRLQELLSRPDLDDDHAEQMIKLVEDLGGRRAAETIVSEHLRKSLAAVDRLSLPAPLHRQVRTLVQFAVTR